jgi:hypothetical protein
MAQFRIDILYEGAWKLFGFQAQQLTADRDRYLTRLQRRLGSEMAEKIVQHVEVSCGRLLPLAEFRDPSVMCMKEFFELLAREKALLDINHQIEGNAIFYDWHHELLTTLGISEQDVRRLIDGQHSPGYIGVENVRKLMAMVLGAKQRGVGDADDVRFYRKRRKELVQYLQRVLLVGEPGLVGRGAAILRGLRRGRLQFL